jgi:hypothetical protein
MYVQCEVLYFRPTEDVCTGTGRRQKFSKQKILLPFLFYRKPKKFSFYFEVSACSRVRGCLCRYFVFGKLDNSEYCKKANMSLKLRNMYGRIITVCLVWPVSHGVFIPLHYVIEIITSIKSLMALSLTHWMIIIW